MVQVFSPTVATIAASFLLSLDYPWIRSLAVFLGLFDVLLGLSSSLKFEVGHNSLATGSC